MIHGYIRTSRARRRRPGRHAPRNPGPGPGRCRRGSGQHRLRCGSLRLRSGKRTPGVDRTGRPPAPWRTLTVAALDRISRNRVELVAVVESLHRRGMGIASLAPSESWLHPLGAHPTEVERMMGEIILRVMAWAAQAELESIKRRIEAGVPAGS